MKRVALIVGTRPEAIKLAPLVLALRESAGFKPFVINTRQHPELADEMLGLFGITADLSLKVFFSGQSLNSLSARLLEEFRPVLEREQFAALFVQGDTTSAFCGALAGFYADVPVAHVEAGLRTSTPRLPFPEEMNRRLITRLVQRHYAPTQRAVGNLLAEGIDNDTIQLTGNTGIDAARLIGERLEESVDSGGAYVLCTMHRRENWGAGVEAVCVGIRRLVEADPQLRIVFIKHPNPIVADLIDERLTGEQRVMLLPPQPYEQFLKLFRQCALVISDSGGVAEEASVFKKPVLIARDETERVEALEAGYAQVVGTDSELIFQAAAYLLSHPLGSATFSDPFGDGHAAEYIVKDMETSLWFQNV